MQGVKRYAVRLLPHDECWEEEFLETKAQIQNLWGDEILDIQHFGSTSVKGIWAKPILDVAVLVKSFAAMRTDKMERAGYENCGLQRPDRDRFLFVLRGAGEISLRHIHVYEPGNRDFALCVGFRDYLNAHPKEAEEYSVLKRHLAAQHPDDRMAYTAGKWDFVSRIYRKLKAEA